MRIVNYRIPVYAIRMNITIEYQETAIARIYDEPNGNGAWRWFVKDIRDEGRTTESGVARTEQEAREKVDNWVETL